MMKRIKVMHIAQAAGGVDRYLRMLLKYLDKEKFENIVVLSQDFHGDDYVGVVSAFEQIHMTRAISIHDFRTIYKVRKMIKKYCPDIVYAHSSKAGAIARIANIGMKNHCVYNSHGWAFNMKVSPKKQKLYILIERMAALLCDKIICISDAEKKSALSKNICRKNKLQVIFNGVDIKAYESSMHGPIHNTDLGISDDSIIVGMVGRLCEQKAPDVFVKAAKLIKQDIPSAHFDKGICTSE